MEEEKVDPEMIKNLDFLMELDLVEAEKDWDLIDEMDEVEAQDE